MMKCTKHPFVFIKQTRFPSDKGCFNPLDSIQNTNSYIYCAIRLKKIHKLQITEISHLRFSVFLILDKIPDNFRQKVENFHSTDDGKPSEKSHGASNCWEHVYKFCCSVLGDSIKCRGVKEYSHISQSSIPLILYKHNIYRLLFCNNFVIQTLDCHRELNELFIIVIISKQFVHDILQ